MKIGYLKQYIGLFGFKYGTRLYFNLLFRKMSNLKLPSIKSSIQLRDNECDLKVFHQIFVNNEYSIPIPFEVNNIVDGGANIGLFSLYINAKYPEAKIVAIEPDSENFEICSQNLNSLKNAQLIKKAIWCNETKLSISDKFESGKRAMIVEEDKLNGEIETISIDQIIKLNNWETVDILKLDIETSEKYLFSTNY